MPGVVVELMVAEGDVVEQGQVLVVLEAMKMQNPLQAEAGGVVTHVAVTAGDCGGRWGAAARSSRPGPTARTRVPRLTEVSGVGDYASPTPAARGGSHCVPGRTS